MAAPILTLNCDGLKICNPGKIDKIEIAISCCSFDNPTVYYGNVCDNNTLTPSITFTLQELIPPADCAEIYPLKEGCECAAAIKFKYILGVSTSYISSFTGTFSYLDPTATPLITFPIDLTFFNIEHEEYQTEWKDILVEGTFITTQGCEIRVNYELFIINKENPCGYNYPVLKDTSQFIVQPENKFEVDGSGCIIIPVEYPIFNYQIYIGPNLQYSGCEFLDCEKLQCNVSKYIQSLIGKCDSCSLEYSEAMELLLLYESIGYSNDCCEKCMLLEILLDKLSKCTKC